MVGGLKFLCNAGFVTPIFWAGRIERQLRMTENKGLLSSGLGMVLHNKRYIVWFYVLNLLLGLFGTAAFANQAGTILNQSLHSQRLLHGFSLGVLTEMFARPEFGPTGASSGPAIFFSVLFMVATALFLPECFRATPRLIAFRVKISSARAAGICGVTFDC